MENKGSGLVRALADAFIADHVKESGCNPFAVKWLGSDTVASFKHLALASADLIITYHDIGAHFAAAQGKVDRLLYALREYFMLVGTSYGAPCKPVYIPSIFRKLAVNSV